MNFLETHDLVISTLSPVHIGCGEDYEPTNYVIDGNTLYAFDPARLLAELLTEQLDELLRALDDRDPVRAAQRFFYRHRQIAMQIADFCVPVSEEIAQFYASRVGQVANREGDGKSVINKLEIARTAFDPISGLPILPGSSLKGAMRTAVLESLRAQSEKSYPISDQEVRNWKTVNEKARDMERDLLGGSFNTDPFRLVKVSDAHFVTGSYKLKNAQGKVIERERLPRDIFFQVKRKKRPNKHESCGNIETLVECVPALQPRAFAAQLTIERKAKQGEATPSLQMDFATLAQACNAFYLAHFERELKILQDNRYVSESWVRGARARLQPDGIWGKAISEGRGFLLRVGRHSGAESVTIDAPRKIMKGKGQQATWEKEATTLWLAASNRNPTSGMCPFGWVFVQKR